MTATDWSVSVRVTETRGELSEVTIVPSHKSVAIGTPLLPIDPLLCLLERNVHVTINGLQLAWIDIRDQLEVSRRRGYEFQEVAGPQGEGEPEQAWLMVVLFTNPCRRRLS